MKSNIFIFIFISERYIWHVFVGLAIFSTIDLVRIYLPTNGSIRRSEEIDIYLPVVGV